MAVETIFQHEILTKFAYPFLLIFFIVFAVLEKTKVFGDEKKQLNALLAFVIGLIFISFVSPKLVVENLILFLTIALVMVFVVLLIWGFATGGKLEIGKGWVKWTIGVVAVLGVIIVLLVTTGFWSNFYEILFQQSWSNSFWTNFFFIVVIAAALALMLKKVKS